MSKKLQDKIVVVDVESTCWDSAQPRSEPSEIIEIGACLLNIHTGERSSKESLLVRTRLSSVSQFCTQLTTLTQERVNQGLQFRDACQVLVDKFKTKERVWASYGDYDREQFRHQCSRDGVESPFGSRHINVKSLFAIINELKHEVGMREALQMAGIQLEGTHHRGGDDAWNIAAILSDLILFSRKWSHEVAKND